MNGDASFWERIAKFDVNFRVKFIYFFFDGLRCCILVINVINNNNKLLMFFRRLCRDVRECYCRLRMRMLRGVLWTERGLMRVSDLSRCRRNRNRNCIC